MSALSFPQGAACLVPYAFAKQYQLLAWQEAARLNAVGTAQTPHSALAELMRSAGSFDYTVVETADFEAAMQTAFSSQLSSAQSVLDEVGEQADLARLLDDIPAVEDLLDAAADAPIIRLINALLTQAIQQGASDVHIEPFEDATVVRLRVDGTLRDIARPKRALHQALVSRIKIMASLDIGEKRLPQDGRMSLRLGGRAVDVRVSTLPVGGANTQAERAVLRLLDKSDNKLDLSALGMPPALLPRFKGLVNKPHGIVLVTGPTGSGKTTTLYAALRSLPTSTTNIMTVEDPIEYELPNIGQTQVNPKIDLSFAQALRAILRQDPDVVMIGEIRDLETAQIAIQASLTGHLVLATLHTNDAVSAPTRLIDMGIEPFLLSSSLLGVLAQRLVRKACPHCKVFNAALQSLSSQGCEQCQQSGYSGRTGIYELLEITPPIAAALHNRASEAELLRLAQAQGYQSLAQDAQRLVAAGVTTAAEALRVAGSAEAV